MPNRVAKSIRIKYLPVPYDASSPTSHVTAVSGCSYWQLMEANRKGAVNGAILETYEAPPKNLFAVPPDYNDCLDYF